METGRTISASFLTELDKKTITLYEQISKTLFENIPSKELQKEYWKEFGKTNKFSAPPNLITSSKS